MTVESATGPSTRWISGDLGAGWQRVECGTYRYGISPAGTTTFEPSGVVERYVEFISEDGARRRTRALRDARATPAGVELRVETWGDHVEFGQIELALLGAPEDIAVRYEIDGRHLVVRGQDGGVERKTLQLEVPRGSLYLPLTRNHLGAVIIEVSERSEGRALVVVPDLRDPTRRDLFAPLLDMRHAAPVDHAPGPLVTAGRTWSAVEYRFEGGPYDQRARFWIEHGSRRLLRYIFAAESGERWCAELVHLESSPV